MIEQVYNELLRKHRLQKTASAFVDTFSNLYGAAKHNVGNAITGVGEGLMDKDKFGGKPAPKLGPPEKGVIFPKQPHKNLNEMLKVLTPFARPAALMGTVGLVAYMLGKRRANKKKLNDPTYQLVQRLKERQSGYEQ